MVVLAVETVTPAGSYGLAQGPGPVPVHGVLGDPGIPHAVRLPAALVAFLGSQGLTLDDVTRAAVVIGPGSFTGVRIGVACVQGLAVTRGWQVAAVSTLEAIAEGWRHVLRPARPQTVLACLDGMRGEVFTAAYAWDGAALTQVVAPAVGAPSPALLDDLSGPVSVVGSGATRHAAVWAERAEVLEALEPLAASAARLAASEAWPVVSPHALRPAYVRRPDVELARDRRRGQA